MVDRALYLSGASTGGMARSLRCVFEFLSAGVLLPGGFGLPDPLMEPPDFSKMKDDKEKEMEHRRLDITGDLTDRFCFLRISFLIFFQTDKETR